MASRAFQTVLNPAAQYEPDLTRGFDEVVAHVTSLARASEGAVVQQSREELARTLREHFMTAWQQPLTDYPIPDRELRAWKAVAWWLSVAVEADQEDEAVLAFEEMLNHEQREYENDERRRNGSTSGTSIPAAEKTGAPVGQQGSTTATSAAGDTTRRPAVRRKPRKPTAA